MRLTKNGQRVGRPPKEYEECLVDDCKNTAECGDYCWPHYRRWWKHGDPEATPLRKGNSTGVCSVDGCDNQRKSLSYCSAHYFRLVAFGDVQADKPLRKRSKHGTGYLTGGGYVGFGKNPARLEHRQVMEQMIGRELLREERVHHKNGVRTDNRPENLEPWVVGHPPGERVIDLVHWAQQILERYENLVDILDDESK